MEPPKHQTAPEPPERASRAAAADPDADQAPAYQPLRRWWLPPPDGHCGIQRARGSGRTSHRINVPPGVAQDDLSRDAIRAQARAPMPGADEVELGEMPRDRDVYGQPITGSVATSADGRETGATLDARPGHFFRGRAGSLAGIAMHGHRGPGNTVDLDKESHGEVEPGRQWLRETAALGMDEWEALRAAGECHRLQEAAEEAARAVAARPRPKD